MFEDAVITEQKRPWTVAVSLTVQSACVGAIVLLSILTIDSLPVVALPVPLPPLPSPLRAVEIVAAERMSAAPAANAVIQPRAFTAPARIPAGIPNMLDDGPPAAAPSISGTSIADTGLPPGVYSGAQVIGADQVAAPPPAAAAPPEPEAPKVIRIGGQVLEAKIIRRVIPEYPRLARDMRVSGRVRLVGIIRQDGMVRDLKVVEGHPLLVKAAVDAVRQWVYSPTTLNGKPVEVIAPIDVHFTLAP